MPRMRHPKIPGAEFVSAASAVPFHRRAGWLTDEEWARAGLPEPEPEPEPEEAEEQASSGKTTSATPRRSRSRATSERNDS